MLHVNQVLRHVLSFSAIKRATKFVSEREVVRATRIHCKALGQKPRKGSNVEIRLTVGKPNYAERVFIKNCLAANEPFPVKKVQLKYFPKPRARG